MLIPEQIVFVDEDGKPTGETGPKLESHTDKTKLHLAFSCYIFRKSDNKFLVTQRALSKKVWPGVWTNSVCGHPAPQERLENAIRRRATFELGIDTLRDIRVVLPNYRYTTPPYNGIIENEFCPVFVACVTADPQPNPDEVASWMWVDWAAYIHMLRHTPEKMSYWAKDQYQQLKSLEPFQSLGQGTPTQYRQIILASSSPRRKDLLQQMGVEFRIVPSNFDEYLDHNRPAADVAKELGLGKARVVAEKYPDALVIGGDTIVTVGDKQLGKPKDEAEARATLRAHAGQQALVTSSVVLVCKALGLETANVDKATVRFKPYNKTAHETYLASGDWRDKAGGWGIQSGAAPMIASVHGDYDTILGMPTKLLADMLQARGVQAYRVTPPSDLKL